MIQMKLGFKGSTGGTGRAIEGTVIHLFLSTHRQDVVEHLYHGDFVRCVSNCDAMGCPIHILNGGVGPMVETLNVFQQGRASAGFDYGALETVPSWRWTWALA